MNCKVSALFMIPVTIEFKNATHVTEWSVIKLGVYLVYMVCLESIVYTHITYLFSEAKKVWIDDFREEKKTDYMYVHLSI